jgi:hypothetical protein
MVAIQGAPACRRLLQNAGGLITLCATRSLWPSLVSKANTPYVLRSLMYIRHIVAQILIASLDVNQFE